MIHYLFLTLIYTAFNIDHQALTEITKLMFFFVFIISVIICNTHLMALRSSLICLRINLYNCLGTAIDILFKSTFIVIKFCLQL